MSFSDISEAIFRPWRLLLKICRWVPVKMSSHFGFCGFSVNSKQKKAREASHGVTYVLQWKRLLFIFLGFLLISVVIMWVLAAWDTQEVRIQEAKDFTEKNIENFIQSLNVSKEQVHDFVSVYGFDQVLSLACNNSFVHTVPVSFSGICALKLLSSRNSVSEKGLDWADENLEPAGQCPVRNEDIFMKLDVLFQNDRSPFLSGSASSLISLYDQCCSGFMQNALLRAATETSTRDGCKTSLFCFSKMSLWIMFGIAVGWQIRKLSPKLCRDQTRVLVRTQPTAQQPQLNIQQFNQQHVQILSRTTGKWRKKLLVVFVICGILGSIWLFWYLNEDGRLRRKETLVSMCDERARMLQDQFNVSMNHVHALAILVSTFYHGKEPSALDQKTFEEYTEKTAFERPLTSGVAYALKVPHSARKEFEKKQGWPIRKMDDDNQSLAKVLVTEDLDIAPIQDEYAPVIFTQETVSHLVSIDMMSGKEDRENILRARASGKGVLTSPLNLLKFNHIGVILTFAVYNTNLPDNATDEQRVNAAVGYLGASYDVPSLVERLLHQLASKQTIAVNVYDTTNNSSPIKMYGDDENDTGLLHYSYLDFGDPTRKHEMHCRFKHKPPLPWTAIIASSGLLVIILLLGHIFHAAINRISKVERDYWEMMQLKHRAEAADIAKSQFLATVSHEIRTPMNGVLGMLQMLMETNLDVNQLDYAQVAHASGRDLISLINEVLDQAKIESGRLELEAVPFDLRADLDKVVSLHSGKLHDKEIELAVYVSNQVPETVVGDPGRFRQIITNLVGNSIKFTKDKGHIFVTVHLADEVKNPVDIKDEVLKQSQNLVRDQNSSFNTLSGLPVVNRWRSWENFKNLNRTQEENQKIQMLVTIEDTGEGIPHEARERIFTPFVQADSSTSRKYGGTGIGLSISKRLVDLMEGEIGLASESGIGSTFSFTATLSKGEGKPVVTKWQQFDLAVSEFRGLKALVVDEKRVHAEVTKYQLQRLGIFVQTSSMDSACSFLSSDTNLSVSERMGFVFIEKESWERECSIALQGLLKDLRSNGSTSNMGIIPKTFLLTTSKSLSEDHKLKVAGLVDHFLTKPLRFSVLISCLQEATGFRRQKRVSSSPSSTDRNQLRGKNILIVDDNRVNRFFAEVALRKYGAIVTSEASGIGAVKRLKPPHVFNACFMDLQMPEMDGFEATRQIRVLESEFNENNVSGEIFSDIPANVCHWHTPIIAMTADVIQATDEECRKCGMDGYVSKPFDPEQLYSAVAQFFESG